MPYVYKITNSVNGKVYVGQTSRSLKIRFQEHLRKAKYQSHQEPLYRAIRKYGEDAFSIELLEETDSPNEREQFWVKELNSYHNGYNATMGGEGTPSDIDDEQLVSLSRQGKTITEIVKMTGYDKGTISAHLRSNGVTEQEIQRNRYSVSSKPVVQINPKTGEELNTFISQSEAARFLGKANKDAYHIGEVCRGKRKTAYGYAWKYKE